MNLEELISRKNELEVTLRVEVYLKLASKYNKFYFNKHDCEEAILLRGLLSRFKKFPEVREYLFCVDKINLLLSDFSDNDLVSADAAYRGKLLRLK